MIDKNVGTLVIGDDGFIRGVNGEIIGTVVRQSSRVSHSTNTTSLSVVNIKTKVNEEVVFKLNNLLKQAKEGKIKDFAAIWVDERNTTCNDICMTEDAVNNMLASCRLLERDIIDVFAYTRVPSTYWTK